MKVKLFSRDFPGGPVVKIPYLHSRQHQQAVQQWPKKPKNLFLQMLRLFQVVNPHLPYLLPQALEITEMI